MAKKPEPEIKEKETEETAAQAEPEVSETAETGEQETVDPVEAMTAEIEDLTRQLNESKNSLLRAYADTDNTRKRLLKDAETIKKYRFQDAAREILPILDNLDLALASAPEAEEAANFVKGVEMIRTQLANVMKNEGVEEIEALDKPFDATWMQALMQEPKEGTEPGMVTEVLQKGYKLKDRMLRPALVKVSA